MSGTLRPFHETIVEAIRRASSKELECLATFIKATRIPQGHDEIIAAWNEQRNAMCWGDEDLGVSDSLLDQKREAVAAVTNLARSFHSNGKERALMVAIEKVIGLFRNQSGNLSNKASNVIVNLFETAKKISWAKNEEDFQRAIAELRSL